MVFSNKSLQFIIATLVVTLPFLGMANPTTDSLQVQSHKALVENHTNTSEAAVSHEEPTDVKTKIRAFIDHHVLDAHEFSLFEDEIEGAHYGCLLYTSRCV